VDRVRKNLARKIDWLFSVPAGTPLAGFGMSGEEDIEALKGLRRSLSVGRMNTRHARGLLNLSLDDYGADFGLGDKGAVDERLPAEAPNASTIAHFLHAVVNGVAGHHRVSEASLVDGHEIDERRLLELL
jgi:hypothetical protein